MEEEKYPVCEHRNVPEAFERFFGTDSGAWIDSSSPGIASATTSVISYVRAVIARAG